MIDTYLKLNIEVVYLLVKYRQWKTKCRRPETLYLVGERFGQWFV